MPSDNLDFGSDLPEFADDIELTPAPLEPAPPPIPARPLPRPKPVEASGQVKNNRASAPKVRPLNDASPAESTFGSPLATEANDDFELAPSSKRRAWMVSIPSWFISLALHTAILVTMAAYSIEPIKDALTKLVIESGRSEDPTDSQSFELASTEISASDLSEQTEMAPQSMPEVSPSVVEIPMEISVTNLDVGSMANLSMESITSQLVPSSLLSTSSASLTKGLNGRSAATKRDLLAKYGGGDETEKAVAMGLRWLADHQLPDGSWTFGHPIACNGQCGDPGKFLDARNAATGLALMSFLGAGQTHLDGEYKEVVFKGLSFLLSTLRVDRFGGVAIGSWFDDPGPYPNIGNNPSSHNRMYGQGIATTAICEAYGMTNDPKLAEASQLGVNFIVAAQDPRGGGWNYEVRSPGDTSIVGWQIMALKSALMSNIQFPQETIRKTSFFLDSVQTDNGSSYHYRVPGDRNGNHALTACALLCRMYMGMPKTSPGLLVALDKIQEAGPSTDDAYLNYYATQVMKQYGGDHWKKWNEKMKNFLVSGQVNTGHAAGSWAPGNTWGDSHGGRLYRTTMSIMVLEVYYRYLPIYNDQTVEDAFKL